jgi:hypothetical protein
MRKELNMLKREADRWSDDTLFKESLWPTNCPPRTKRVKMFSIASCSVPRVVLKSQVFWGVMIC